MSEALVDVDVKYPGKLQPGVDDRLIDALFAIVKQIETEEISSQDRGVQEARKRELYWRGIQAVYWDDVYQRYDQIVPSSVEEAEAIAKVVNVYKADGESIAAAIASSVPTVRFFPNDADNPDDVLTAKAETRLSEKIAKDNEASMLMFQIMYTLWTEPFVAANINYVEDPSFGYRVVPMFERKEIQLSTPVCATCGTQMGGEEPTDPTMMDEGGMGMGLQDPAAMEQVCPNCGGTEIMPQMGTTEIAAQTGEFELPEGRAVIDIYGISHVRIPFYCRNQTDLPYVFLDSEQHYTLLRDIFKHIKDKIIPGSVAMGETQRSYREAIGSSKDAELATARRVWLRPWVFEMIDDQSPDSDLIQELRTRFPDGVVLYYVNDIFACAYAEGIDDAWVFSKHPMSRYLHNVPLGDSIIPIQDMTNEGTNLFLDLILNSVPPTFVNPKVVNFDNLKNTRQLPGTWIKAKPEIPGQPLDPSFHTPKPPTMSQYLPTFFTMLDARRQHVGGAFPSIYGGAAISGSKTKGEYEQSRSSALQRLGIVWKMINVFWPKVMETAVRCFRKNMADDIKDVQRTGNDFVNIWIRKAEMSGRIGRVESESSEEFPVAWSQIRGILMELLGLGIPQVNEAIINPNNIEFMKKVIGLPQLHITGEDDRTYQLTVIQQLLQSPPMGQMSSVPPDPNLVDIDIAVAVTQSWLKGDQGQEARVMNPDGYMNVMTHLNELIMIQQQQMMAQAAAQMQSEAVPSSQGSKPNLQKSPPTGPPAVTA